MVGLASLPRQMFPRQPDMHVRVRPRKPAHHRPPTDDPTATDSNVSSSFDSTITDAPTASPPDPPPLPPPPPPTSTPPLLSSSFLSPPPPSPSPPPSTPSFRPSSTTHPSGSIVRSSSISASSVSKHTTSSSSFEAVASTFTAALVTLTLNPASPSTPVPDSIAGSRTSGGKTSLAKILGPVLAVALALFAIILLVRRRRQLLRRRLQVGRAETPYGFEFPESDELKAATAHATPTQVVDPGFAGVGAGDGAGVGAGHSAVLLIVPQPPSIYASLAARGSTPSLRSSASTSVRSASQPPTPTRTVTDRPHPRSRSPTLASDPNPFSDSTRAPLDLGIALSPLGRSTPGSDQQPVSTPSDVTLAEVEVHAGRNDQEVSDPNPELDMNVDIKGSREYAYAYAYSCDDVFDGHRTSSASFSRAPTFVTVDPSPRHPDSIPPTPAFIPPTPPPRYSHQRPLPSIPPLPDLPNLNSKSEAIGRLDANSSDNPAMRDSGSKLFSW